MNTFAILLYVIESVLILIFIGGIIFWGRILRNVNFICIILLPLFVFSSPYYSYKGWSSVKKYPEYKSDLNHLAIILAYENLLDKITAYAEGVDLLINQFLKNKEPYKIYFCPNSEVFKKVLETKNAKKLWIFGHGSRHCLYFGKKGKTFYCEVMDCPPKDYIAQFHCNNGMGKSLADYLSPKNFFVTNSMRCSTQNRIDIKKILKEKRY